MRLKIGERIVDLPDGYVVVTLVEVHQRGYDRVVQRVELELTSGDRTRTVYLKPGQQAVLTDAIDFRAGDVIVGPRGQRYTVRSPVRTRRGRLRLTGPLGGSVTFPWRVDRLPPGYRMETGE